MTHWIAVVFSLLISGTPPTENLYGDYYFARDEITLKLSAPDHYTYFATKVAKRSGSVTSTELSRGTFALQGDTLVLSEFPSRSTMKLMIDSEEELRAVEMEALKAGDVLLCWNKYYADGSPRLEAGWRRGKRHGTWVYYDEEGGVVKSESYRRGKKLD